MDVTPPTPAERAARLRQLAEQLARTPATGATVHDLATIRGLANTAAEIAERIAAGEPDTWGGWLDRVEAHLDVYRREGLAGWRRVYRR